MLLDSICNGLIVKNYKELCLLLNEKEKTGESKKSQIKDWERYFKYRKQGHKYIIEDVYEVPMEKLDKRNKGNNAIYIKYIETILLYLLSQEVNQTLVCTKNYLMLKLGIVSKNYIDKYYRTLLVKNKEFKQRDIDEFDGRAYRILDRILFSALNNLQRRCLLNWHQELHIKAINKETGKSEKWVADEDEIRNFTAIKYEVMKQMGFDEDKPEKYDSLRDIYFYHQTEKFYEILRDKLYDEFQWDETCIYYRLIYKKENIIDAIPRTEKQLLQMQQKIELNNKVVDAINQNAETHHANLLNKFQEEYDKLCINNGVEIGILPLDCVNVYVPNSSYISIQRKIAEKLVKL
jgi:uncharacterized protein YqiB (DUF1249 family)